MMRKWILAPIVVAGVAVYLGLAVLAWGGLVAFFSHPARLALVIVSFALCGASIASAGNLSRGEREDRAARLAQRRDDPAVRTPSYLGLLVNALGWALVFRSAFGVLLTILMLPPLFARMRSEETLLLTQFGNAYDLYCTRTARLIPGIY